MPDVITTNLTINGGAPIPVTNGVPTALSTGMKTHLSDGCSPVLNRIVITDTFNGAVKTAVKFVGYEMNKLMLGSMGRLDEGLLTAGETLNRIVGEMFVGIFNPVYVKDDSGGYALVTPDISNSEGKGKLASILNIPYLRFAIEATYNTTSKYYWPVTMASNPTMVPNTPSWAAYAGIEGSLGGGATAMIKSGVDSDTVNYYKYALSVEALPTDTVYNAATPGSTITFQLIAYVSSSAISKGATAPAHFAQVRPWIGSAKTYFTSVRESANNPATISVANTNALNADNYTDDYGWVGTYDPNGPTDESITVTITRPA